jgi:lysylphosphatidylglycerol synthetase-like protein (DUF2156 family)
MVIDFLYFAAGTCSQGSFFGLPTWYSYLVAAGKMQVSDITGRCEFVSTFQITDLSLIALALLDIALRIAGLVALAYVIYGGVQYVISQGEPDKAKNARQTIINALIGMTIAIVATGVVSFVGNRLG